MGRAVVIFIWGLAALKPDYRQKQIRTPSARAQREEGIFEPDTWVFVAWYSWLVVLLATIAFMVFH
jgi:hypothetical protein